MEATHSETTGSTGARSYDLDAMGLGPPTKVRRRGKIDKWTRILGVAVVLLLVFNIGVRLGHASRPKAATPSGGAGAGAAGAGAAGAGAGARGTQGGGAGAGAGAAGDAGAKPVATGAVKVVDGNSIYVSQPDGTTKKVVANDSTRYTRTQPSTLRDIQPGDQVSVEGSTQPDGSVSATRVSDRASTLQQP